VDYTDGGAHDEKIILSVFVDNILSNIKKWEQYVRSRVGYIYT